jgi:zinc/manganese transport system substrate-binding protein
LWLDPGVAYVYTEIVADEFIIYDGIRQDYYMSSFVAYRDRLLALQAELEAELAVIPAERRKLITMHDSFTHFARRFDFTVVAVAGTEPVTALAEAEVERLVQEAQREGVPAVFAEYGYDDSAMAEVARRAGVPLCRLYTEMVPLGDGVESYEEMMRANVRELVRCLGA